MEIVVLDGYALNPGDISWEALKTLGKVTIYDRTPAGKVLERSAGAEVILTNKTPLPADVIQQLHATRFIGVLATGYNVVDVAAAKQKGILVSNVPDYGTASVVQFTMALLLELCHRVQRHSDAVMEGRWARSADWCFWDYPLVELAGKSLGIIGFGRIGQGVADVATALGMNIIAYSRTQTDQSHRKNFRWAGLPELLAQSDVVTIHCPLFPDTKGLINRETLGMMKKTAFLLNTSRGPIVVDDDLADALNKEVIAGAGIDVLSVEPPAGNNPLFGAKNCIVTPHIAWATREARTRMMDIVVKNVSAYQQGSPVNVVS